MKAEEYSERGTKYFRERNFDGAILDFTEQIKLEQDNPFPYVKRGMSYMNKKEYDLAITDFNTAIQLEPDKFGNFYMERAGAYVFKGNMDMAIADMEMAVKIDPQNTEYRDILEECKLDKTKAGRIETFGDKVKNIGNIIAIIFIALSIIGGIASKNLSVPIMTIVFIGVIYAIVDWIKKKAQKAKEFFS